MRRSLVLKTALYATITFFVAIPPTAFVARQLMDAGRHADFKARLGPQATFVERTVEREWTGHAPDPARLAELGDAFRHDLRWVPWGAPEIPAALAADGVILAPGPPDGKREHWLRIDAGGKPVGALAMRPRGPGAPGEPKPPPGHRFPGGPAGADMAGLWLLLLAFVIVPPLYLWVLRPLREMVGVAGRLASGDLETPVAVDRRDEFGELEGAFEHLRVELKKAIDQRERLLTDVSHEIRAPLARMMIALPLMKGEGAPGPITAIFERELRAVDDMVGEVLALVRGGYQPLGGLAELDLAALAAEGVEAVAADAAARHLTVTTDLAAAPMLGDARLVGRAVGNLLANAVQHANEGDAVQVVTAVEDGRAVLRVADTGPGIHADHLPHVFEPFWRPDTSRSRETGGAGLGLAIVKRIAEAHGGAVALASPPGAGTTAELRFPLRG